MIGDARKDISLLPGVETDLYVYNGSHPGQITIMWFTGALLWLDFGQTLIRVYVDQEAAEEEENGRAAASIAFPIHMGLGIGGHGLDVTPFGTPFVGKLGFSGGVYCRFAIPFGRAVRVTAEQHGSEREAFYFMVRGMVSRSLDPLPLRLEGGGSMPLELPADRARLKLAVNRDVLLAPLQWMTLLNTTRSGALVAMVQSVQSGNAHFLEGTHELEVSGRKTQSLSSGFEDFFLSCQYFDAGQFATVLSGLTYESSFIEPHSVTAYRTFVGLDPIFFHAGASNIIRWQNGRHSTGPLQADHSKATSYTWYYEY